MKKLMTIACMAMVLTSCNDANKEQKEAEPAKAESTTNADVKLPFPMETPYNNWQIGSTENVVTAMSALKAFVDNDFNALAAVTGDSLTLNFDGLNTKLSRDSAMKFFTAERAKYKDLSVKMYDYVSVISADKSTEWVTLWYKQIWKDDKGVADSIDVTDDVKVKDGKMVRLDEKSIHFQKK